MNASATTFFNKHLMELRKKYSTINKEIESHKNKVGITSHLTGDCRYYELCIKKWETFMAIKRIEAILDGTEFSYIRHHKPVALNNIRRCQDLKNHVDVIQ